MGHDGETRVLDYQKPPPRRPSASTWKATAVWLAVNAAAMCVAWRVADWRVPLPPRPSAVEAVGAWTQGFNLYFRTFFVAYVAACIILLYLVGFAFKNCRAMQTDVCIPRRNAGPTRAE